MILYLVILVKKINLIVSCLSVLYCLRVHACHCVTIHCIALCLLNGNDHLSRRSTMYQRVNQKVHYVHYLTHWSRDGMANICETFSMTFVPKYPINNIPILVQIMVCYRPGDKPLSEPMMIILLTHICVTRPQLVKFRFVRKYNIMSRQQCRRKGDQQGMGGKKRQVSK